MGRIVVINSPICYLIGVDGKNIFAIPRGNVEPEVKNSKYNYYINSPIEDTNVYNYFNIGPWSHYYKVSSIFDEKEELLRKIIIIKLPNNAIFEISKNEFENSIQPKALAVAKLVNLLEAYAWVSNIVTIECHDLGNDYDYNFNIYEKSTFSFIGTKGKLLFTFRWNELNCLRILNYSGFEIDTRGGRYRGWLNKGGYPTKDQLNQSLSLIRHNEYY